MRFLLFVTLLGGVLPFCGGCSGGSQPAQAAVQPPANANNPAPPHDGNREAKHPLVRALLDSLNGVEAEEADIRSVRQSLYDADEELVRVGGDNLREAILRANQKPPTLLIHPEYQEPLEVVPTDDVAPTPADPDIDLPAEEPTADVVPGEIILEDTESPTSPAAPADDPFGTP